MEPDALEWLENQMTPDERELFSAAFFDSLEEQGELCLHISKREIKILGYRGEGGTISCA